MEEVSPFASLAEVFCAFNSAFFGLEIFKETFLKKIVVYFSLYDKFSSFNQRSKNKPILFRSGIDIVGMKFDEGQNKTCLKIFNSLCKDKSLSRANVASSLEREIRESFEVPENKKEDFQKYFLTFLEHQYYKISPSYLAEGSFRKFLNYTNFFFQTFNNVVRPFFVISFSCCLLFLFFLAFSKHYTNNHFFLGFQNFVFISFAVEVIFLVILTFFPEISSNKIFASHNILVVLTSIFFISFFCSYNHFCFYNHCEDEFFFSSIFLGCLFLTICSPLLFTLVVIWVRGWIFKYKKSFNFSFEANLITKFEIFFELVSKENEMELKSFNVQY